MLNTLFLVACILIVIASVLYIFFSNRFLGFLLGLLIRLGYWNQASSSVWVEFGSVQLSVLAGRVLFKDLRYYSSNQTVRIVKCQFNWRYWIRKTAEEEDLNDNSTGVEDDHEKGRRTSLPCRIHISIEGLEWFLYNRTPAYDDIVSHMGSKAPPSDNEEAKSSSVNDHASLSHSNDDAPTYPPRRPIPPVVMRVPVFVREAASWLKRQLPNLHPKNLLPFSFEVTKAAITCGNPSTRSLVMTQFTRAQGIYGIVQSRSKLDFYKQLLRVKLDNASVTCIDNEDYRDNMLAVGKDVADHLLKMKADKNKIELSSYLHFGSFLKLLRLHLPIYRNGLSQHGKAFDTMKTNKIGAKKRLQEESHIGANFSVLEYAIDRKLLEAPILELTYYADVAGNVPQSPKRTGSRYLEQMDIGNGDLPPEWGVGIVIHGGLVRYGPWADRQRAEIQRAFFPPTFHHATPTAMLSPGDQRICTCLKVFMELRGSTSLYIPFREASKNWQWDGKVDVPHFSKLREAASIQLRAGDNSTVKYLMPMVATEQGFDASLEVYLDNVIITSSLNDIKLLSADSCHISAHLPAPLMWNSERQWTFELSMSRPILYIIRDHINMLADLGKDWSSGPPSDFHSYVPMIYVIKLGMSDYELNLYANDHNIIDRPLVKEENALFTCYGASFQSDVLIPSNTYRPESTAVSFSVNAPDVILTLSLPRWNTHALYATRRLTEIGHISSFGIKGTYLYFAEVREEHIDQLNLDFKCRSITFKVFGWAIRNIMVLRDNYFGSFTQFSTTGEYLDKRDKDVPVGDPVELKFRIDQSNPLQVGITLHAQGSVMFMPSGLPGYDKGYVSRDTDVEAGLGPCAMYSMPDLQLQLRSHDQYMEMSLNIAPLAVAVADNGPDAIQYDHSGLHYKELVSIDGIDITANRLFGPPPRTATYVCMWEIRVGEIKGAVSAAAARVFVQASKTFLQNLSDPLNAPASEYALPPDPDATFLKVAINTIDVMWLAPPATLRILLSGGLLFDSNDLAGKLYHKVQSLRVPSADVQVLLSGQAKRRYLEVASLHFGISFDVYNAPYGWRRDAEDQRQFLLAQDASTNRVPQFTDFKSVKENGRQTLRGTLYLPSARFPNLRSRESNNYNRRAPPPNTKSSRPRHLSRRSSESDEEFNISEIDRDTRLAKSRPNTLTVPINPGRDDMSSGDESDEADSISQATWSDISDSDEDGVDEVKSPRLSLYWGLCRHFAVESDRSPSSWNSSSISLLKDNSTPRMRDLRFTSSDLMNPKSSNPGFHEHPEQNEDAHSSKRFMRVAATNDVYIHATPLLAKAGPTLLEAMYNDNSSPELRIDAIVSDTVTPVEKRALHSVLDVFVPSITVSLVQDLMSMEESIALVTSSPVAMKSDQRTHIRVVSIAEWTMVGVHALCSIPSQATESPISQAELLTSAKVEIEKAALTLGATISHSNTYRGSIYNTHPAPTLYLDLGPTDGTLLRQNVNFNLGSFTARFHRNAPEITIPTIRTVQKTVKTVNRAHAILSRQARCRLQHLVHDILNHSPDTSTRSLLSTIQPSFLVQSGRPHKLRQDMNWKFMFQLRHSLQYMGEQERLSLDTSPLGPYTTISAAEIDPVLKRQSGAWIGDGENFTSFDIPILRFLYSAHGRSSPMSTTPITASPIKSVTFRTKSSQFIFEEAELQNTIAFGPIFVRSQVMKRHLLAPSHSSRTPVSKGSPRDRLDNPLFLSLTSVVAVDYVLIDIFPNVIPFLRHLIHVQRLLKSTSKKQGVPAENDRGRGSATDKTYHQASLWGEFSISIHQIRIQLAAENIVFELAAKALSSSTTCYMTRSTDTSSRDVSINQALGFEEFSIKVKHRSMQQNDALAAFVISQCGFSCVYRRDFGLRCALHLKSVRLSVPRSAIRTYHFLEQWRADYLPGMDAMVQALFSEIRSAPKDHSPGPRQSTVSFSTFQLHVSIDTFAVSLQVMLGTWLSWSVIDTTAYMRNVTNAYRKPSYTFGMQLLSQTIMIRSISEFDTPQKPFFPNSSVNLDLPAFRTSGSYDNAEISVVVLVDFFEINIKPTHWDALLSVQQKFGQDFNDLLLLVEDTRKKRPSIAKEKRTSQLSSPTSLNLSGRFKGFRIGLEGPSYTLFLECEDIDGTVADLDGRRWQINFSDLALSLSPRILSSKAGSSFTRQMCSAFVILDLQANNSVELDLQSHTQFLEVAVTKLHAVMQPSSIGEIGDFVDHLQAELFFRKDQRALELDEFKEKARKVMRTFNMNPRTAPMADRGTFFGNRSVKLTVANFGAAFPLSLDQNLVIPQAGARGTLPVKAFLFSIVSLSFRTQRGETGQAIMEGFSLQFVPRFKQSDPADFRGETHQTRNRLFYPEMTAHVHSQSSASSRQLHLGATVRGFILDLDPSITDYIFSVIDVYRHGKSRMERLAAGLPRSTVEPQSMPPLIKTSTEAQYNAIPTTGIQASLKFLSGKVRMYSDSSTKVPRSSSVPLALHSIKQEHLDDHGADIFSLPELSVWSEFRATPARQKLSTTRATQPSQLVFKSTIHSSQNTLRPSLLPFLTEIIHNVEDRMQKVPSQSSRPPSIASHASAPVADADKLVSSNSATMTSLQISFTLRIDQSRLELTCQPDVNVVAGLHWESGGFVVNVAPGAQRVSITGSVGGLSAALKHGFLSEDCARLDARNLNFSIVFSKVAGVSGRSTNSISVVIDTEFAGGVRLSRLQDLLCFKAVWLDRIPVLNGDAVQGPSTTSRLKVVSSSEQAPKQGFTTAIILRARQIKLDADLGQSISAVTLELRSVLVRTRLTEHVSELSVSMAHTDLVAHGNLSGSATMPDFLFKTIRRRQGSPLDGDGRSKMLELTITSGILDMMLESDKQWLLQYRAEPLEIIVFDDWAMIAPTVAVADRRLRLYFTVTGSKASALMTLGTIPKLIIYAGKFKANLEAQREGARRESNIFRSTRGPRPENALSEVANAMFQSARSKLRETETLTYAIAQHMSLQLDELHFVLFPRALGDAEIARFIGRNVKAELERLVDSQGPTNRRDLLLSLSHMAIAQLVKPPLDTVSHEQASDVLEWSQQVRGTLENVIFSLPAMVMRMRAQEERTGDNHLLYDFDSKFVRQGERQNSDNISITFNLGLYSWLTGLNKTFSSELKRAQEVAEWRPGHVPALLTTAANRKRTADLGEVPEALDASHIPRSTTPQPIESDSSTSPTSPSKPAPVTPLAKSKVLRTGPSTRSRSGTITEPYSPTQGPTGLSPRKSSDITYIARSRHIERLRVRQLGEATPDVMHPFFTKRAGFNLETALPQYVHEYATLPVEEIMKALVKIYSKQLRVGKNAGSGGPTL